VGVAGGDVAAERNAEQRPDPGQVRGFRRAPRGVSRW
jgi:hypothetical protein